MAPRIIVSWAVAIVVVLAVPSLASARSFVTIDNVHLDRAEKQATVTADVHWDAEAATTERMRVGTTRLVAIDDRTHLPTPLGEDGTTDIKRQPDQRVTIVVKGTDQLAAMQAPNRVALTATQKPAFVGADLDKAYVTVRDVQPYGSKQPHIGTDDCSDRAVKPGAILDYCDLVGAALDHVAVSLYSKIAFECKVVSASTCMRRADLTGATLVGANLSGLNLAGARLNGVDMHGANLDNLSLAGAEAADLDAHGATSDAQSQTLAADLFKARMPRANLSGTVFNGVSFEQADLSGATIQKATWTAVTAYGADFSGADLSGIRLGDAPSAFRFADFTDAQLYGRGGGSGFTAPELQWAYLCRTVLSRTERADRDCKTEIEAPTKPMPGIARTEPFIRITKAGIDPLPHDARRVRATITWQSGAGMPSGSIRLVAVDRRTGVPTLIDERAYQYDLPAQTTYSFDVTDDADLAAMAPGNRVVVTASQHGVETPTRHSYVTVATVQRGPGRGQVGKWDCSRVELTSTPAQPLDYCDLTGADLSSAAFNSAFLREASLTGARMFSSILTATDLGGAAMGGVNADRSTWQNADLFHAHAPRLSLQQAGLSGSPLRAQNLDRANFRAARMLGSTTTFAGASLRGAVFSGASLDHADLAFTDLTDAQLDDVTSTGELEFQGGSTLFLSDLTRANLARSTWTPDEIGDVPWKWSTLCETTMPRKTGGFDGDRDCARVWGARNR
jgi:uncharacterized protein YjbI with pentapeptide repeats